MRRNDVPENETRIFGSLREMGIWDFFFFAYGCYQYFSIQLWRVLEFWYRSFLLFDDIINEFNALWRVARVRVFWYGCSVFFVLFVFVFVSTSISVTNAFYFLVVKDWKVRKIDSHFQSWEGTWIFDFIFGNINRLTIKLQDFWYKSAL